MNFRSAYILILVLGSTQGAQGLVEDNPRDFGDLKLETTELQVIYSNNGIVRAQVTSPKRLQYQNGDIAFPDGIYGIFYDKDGQIIGNLRANQAYQYVGKNVYELKGDVEIKSYQEQMQRQLNTEELCWNLDEHIIYTDKFVRIESEKELLTGYGLFAQQDLSYYTISEPQGFAHMDSMVDHHQ